MFSPPPICAAIKCPPSPTPYTSSLTLQELTDFGFPPVPQPLHAPLSLQLSFAEVKYLTAQNQSNFCEIDLILQNWCGLTVEVYPNAFKYAFFYLAQSYSFLF